MSEPSVVIISTHPIQYLSPLYRTLSELGTTLVVYYASDFSIRGTVDPDFTVDVAWDVPLLEGYPYRILNSGSRNLTKKDFFAFNSPQLFQLLWEQSPRAIMVQGYTPYLYLQAVWAAKRAKIPILMRGDTTDMAQKRNFVKKWLRNSILYLLYRQIAVCLPVGHNSYQHYRAHGVPQHRLIHSPFSVDNVYFQSQAANWLPQRAQTRQELGFKEQDLVIAFAGKLGQVKDVFTLARAVKALENKVGVLWIGDGPLRQELQEMCLAQNFQRHVFVGFQNQSQISKYYAAADVLVLPSISETWGLVVNEFMNFARPVIVSDRVGCAPDLVSHGETGFIFPAGDDKVLAQYIELFIQNRNLLEQMGQKAFERVSEYSLERAAQGIIQALELVSS